MQGRLSLWYRDRHTFCSRCRFMLAFETQDDNVGQERRPHHCNRSELQRAASAGCFICRIVLDEREMREVSFGDDFNSEQGTVWCRRDATLPDDLVSSFRLRMYGSETQDGHPDIFGPGRSDFTVRPVQGKDTDLPSRILTGSTSDPAITELVRHWIDTCGESHRHCKSSRSRTTFSPSRLVQFELDGPHFSTARIIETAETPIDGPYMTLSHRWGKNRFLLLTADELPSMKVGFDITILPRAFQDAIRTCQSLGVRWLWIDCLCILQDSPADFQVESEMMHKIYGNSHCNISATGGADNHEGLFFERKPATLDPPIVKLSWNNQKRDYCISHESVWQHHVLNAPVNQRAWVVQERLLAPRVLHFAKQQVFWECQEIKASETYPNGLPNDPEHGFKRAFDGFLNDSTKIRDGFRARMAWKTALEVYASCGLTNPDDKLIAIAGVAARVQSMSDGDEYLAGLWKSDIFHELLWHYDSSAAGKARPKVLRAPSWSWASVEASLNAKLVFRSSGPDPFLPYSLVRAHTSPVSAANPLGAVASGFLHISAKLQRIKFVGGYKPAPTMVNCDIGGRRYDLLVYLDDDQLSIDDDLFCIYHLEEGLLLRLVDQRRGEYCRKGYLSFVRETTGQEGEVEGYGAQADEKSVPCISYDSDQGRHLFSLI